MRWEQQRADHLAEQALPLDLPDPAAQRRGSGRAGLHLAPTGPVIAGTEDAMAIEIQAKSLINRVPGESAMPFRWTINPYRGCTHACVYCLDGATRVLLADGRSRPIAELHVGDQICGTRRDGVDRRYVPTRVLAHWRTVKRAHRVTLADGTTIVASGDHRFLTERGWKHVREAAGGSARRPHLGTGDTLLGLGSHPVPAAARPDHRRGYRSGTSRGDGALATHLYPVDPVRTPIGTGVECGADLRVVSIEDLAEERVMYDITTGTGDFLANGVVSHNCFARNTHTYLDLDAGHDFDSKIIVKVNAGALLRRELASPRWCGEPIAMGTNVDPYQRVEGRYRLMREILGALRDHANPFSILTKGTLIQRDQDLLTQAAAVTDVSVAFSIGFLDETLWRLVEPGTPAPSRRLDLVRRFTDAGIGCSVLMAPILPGLTDQEAELDRTVAALVEAGVTSITPIVLHLRPGAREWYQAFLERHFPRLVQPYRRLYRNGSYAPAAYQRTVVARVRSACRRHGLPDRSAGNFREVGDTAPQAPPAEQLRLV
ncbi:Rv2578c family radical SAM protein [Actinocatenispora sera]|uniref:Intein/intein n=1 Tax=Actinocatenispora sera TaxID=390989 RepID=A0A810L0S8_9ACTN|nr:Rv2578c family radical SAM protein [Actinocatenispora sera]BCJ29013.1 hypothetical protein Asera_31210 [Actinocatenispora sera]